MPTTIMTILMLSILVSCQPSGFNIGEAQKNHKTNKMECSSRVEYELFEMSSNQEKCYNDKYDKKTFFEQVFSNEESYGCSKESFYSKEKVDLALSLCESHLNNPKYKIGEKINFIKDSIYGKDCDGIITSYSYKSFGEATPLYYSNINCNNQIVHESELVAESEIEDR